MNELSAFRRLRAGAPFPDADRLAGPRARLIAVFGWEARRGCAVLPARWVILAGAVTVGAFAVTAGIVVILPEDGPRASVGRGPGCCRPVPPPRLSIFDPESYAYLGQTRDDGEIVSARAAWGVVSRPGARP